MTSKMKNLGFWIESLIKLPGQTAEFGISEQQSNARLPEALLVRTEESLQNSEGKKHTK